MSTPAAPHGSANGDLPAVVDPQTASARPRHNNAGPEHTGTDHAGPSSTWAGSPDADDSAFNDSYAGPNSPLSHEVPDFVRKLAWVLDDAIPILGKRRIGIDGFLSMIPVVGDAAGFGLAATVLLAGVRAGCTWPTIARMLFHALGESLVGMIPLLGPVVAFAWKANSRNLRIIEKNLADREATRRESWKVLLIALALIVLTIAIAITSLVLVIWGFYSWLSGS